MQKINSFRGEYSFLSNFFAVPVTYRNIAYTNNEAAFQAQKCEHEDDKAKFAALGPVEAKKLGRRVVLRRDWERVKFSVMAEIVRAKFVQNPALAKKLLETGDAYLEEGNTWGDSFWGTTNGYGENQLGIILMQVRTELRNSANS